MRQNPEIHLMCLTIFRSHLKMTATLIKRFFKNFNLEELLNLSLNEYLMYKLQVMTSYFTYQIKLH